MDLGTLYGPIGVTLNSVVPLRLSHLVAPGLARLYSCFRLDGQQTGPQLSVSDSYQAVSWTPVRARVLSALYDESPLAMQCNRSSGARFPGEWSAMRRVQVNLPLPAPPRHCPSQGPSPGGNVVQHGAPRGVGGSHMEDWGQADEMEWGPGGKPGKTLQN